MALMPPSDEERELYYYGLPSCPKLVARSSSVTKPWVDPQMPGFTTFLGTLNMYPRVFVPAEHNPLLSQQWNNATSSLRMQIIEAVSIADWAAIDILRVGLDKDDGPDGLKLEFQNTLLIAVVPDSMSWQEGHSLALRCKAILEEHGIIDMHCEIRESVVTLCADADSNAHIRPSSKPITGPDREFKAEISDLLGTKIAMKDSDYIGGTKGLYFELPPPPGGEHRFAALTCRHVALPTDTGGLDEYGHTEAQPPKEAIQVDQPNYTRMIGTLEIGAKTYENTAKKAKKRGQTDMADEYGQLAEQEKDLQQVLKTFESPSSRVFGHLLYSPKPEYTSDHSDGAWYRDWALIELLPSRHQAELSSLRNKVFVGKRESFDKLVVRSYAKGCHGLPGPQTALVDGNGAVELQKVVVPISELIEPIQTVRQTDENAILVAKYGAKSGLRLGLGNRLKSILRRPGTPGDGISEEWCITAANLAAGRQARFSEPGDSGSCIWDMDGRVAGILSAGISKNDLNDTTYAQPLERLLTDIRTHGFDVSLI